MVLMQKKRKRTRGDYGIPKAPFVCMEGLQNRSTHEAVQRVSVDSDWGPEESPDTDNVKYRSGNGDLSFCCLGASNWWFLLSVQMLCVCVCVCVRVLDWCIYCHRGLCCCIVSFGAGTTPTCSIRMSWMLTPSTRVTDSSRHTQQKVQTFSVLDEVLRALLYSYFKGLDIAELGMSCCCWTKLEAYHKPG